MERSMLYRSVYDDRLPERWDVRRRYDDLLERS